MGINIKNQRDTTDKNNVNFHFKGLRYLFTLKALWRKSAQGKKTKTFGLKVLKKRMHSARWMKVWEINEDMIFLWTFASYQNKESEVIIMYLSLYASRTREITRKEWQPIQPNYKWNHMVSILLAKSSYDQLTTDMRPNLMLRLRLVLDHKSLSTTQWER